MERNMENKLFVSRPIEWWLDPKNEWFIQYENRVWDRIMEIMCQKRSATCVETLT